MTKWWNWVLAFALFCLLFVAIPLSLTDDDNKEQLVNMFHDYIQKFNKTYKNDTDEFETRFQHFVESVKEIRKLNAAHNGPEHLRGKFGLTSLSDMSKAEYKDLHLSDEKMKKKRHTCMARVGINTKMLRNQMGRDIMIWKMTMTITKPTAAISESDLLQMSHTTMFMSLLGRKGPYSL